MGWEPSLAQTVNPPAPGTDPEYERNMAGWRERMRQKAGAIEPPTLLDVEGQPDPREDPAFELAPPGHSLADLTVNLGVRSLLAIADDRPPPLLLERLDPEGHTILFGQGGAGKGVLAASWIAELVASGRTVLILDYENHPTEWSRRVGGLGGDYARAGVKHVAPLSASWNGRRGALWHQADDIRALVESISADVLVIDSIVVACAGADPMKPETAALYAGGLERIGLPALSLAHVTKTEDLRYPFGSAFWHNLARTTWSLKPDAERVILTHRKRNNHAGLGRFVVTITWRGDRPVEVWEQGYSAALADRIAEVIGSDRLTVSEMVDRLNADPDDEDTEAVKPDSARAALRRGVRIGRFAVEGSGQTARYRQVEA